MNTSGPPSGLSARTRRRAALLAALVLPVSLMTAPAIAQSPTPSPTSTTSPADATNPTGAALAQAKKDNKRVEIEALRSESTTYFANPDGKTVHAELSSTPIRVKKDGAWQPIDTRLIEKDGVLQPKASLGDLTLSAGGGTEAVSYTNARGKTAIAALATLPKPVVKDNTANYLNAYGPGVDLVVTVTPSGFRHDVVIRQRPAKDLKLRVPMRLPNGLKLGKGSDKTPGVLDAKGKEVDDLAAAPMLDTAAMTNPDKGLIGQASAEVDGDSVVFTAKSAFLNDPQVTYPVTVTTASETWEGTGIAGDTHVSNVLPNGRANSQLLYLLAGRSHSGTRTHRTYIRFNIKGTPLEGGTVKNADLRLHNYNSHTCSDTDSPGIVAHRITDPWTMDTLTWSNQPKVTPSGQVGNTGAYSSTIPCPEGEGELYYSIEQMVQAWMDGQPDEGVRLISPTETVEQNWRFYRSDEYGGYDTYPFTPRGPVLFIEYEPGLTEREEMIPVVQDGPDDQVLTYEEAVARRLETSSSPPQAPAVTPADAQQVSEQSPDSFEVAPDDLLPLPEEEPESSDVTPPTVIETTPADHATNVGIDSTIQTVFSEPVSGTTIIVKDAAGTAVAGIPTSAGENRVTIFTPDQPLTPQATYTVEVSGARDTAGNTLATPYSWSFTTRATPTDPPDTRTISLPVKADTWIDDEGSVGPAGPTLWAGAYGDDEFKAIERTYLSFDTAQIAGKTIVDAKLELWNSASYGCGDARSGIKAQRVTAAWQPGSLIWSNQPTAVADGEAVARDPAGCSGQPPSGTTWTWPLTAVTQAWASGQGNYGVVLRGVDESATSPAYDRGYHASETEEADAHPPVLKVTYVTDGTPDPTPTPDPDTTVPTVVKVSPADGAEDVPADAQVQVTFSEPVTPAFRS